MSATEDEQQNLDAGWDDEPSSSGSASDGDEDVDQAWDSLPPPVSNASAPASSMPPVTEAVDSGWDDVPDGAPGPGGKRRPHRQRRAKSSAVPVAASPVLLPRPAEPTKKHQRDHARKQRAYEAQVKQQRKEERKAERANEMKREAEARKRQAEADALERQRRREERERAERDRPKPTKQLVPKLARATTSKHAPLATSSSERPSASNPTNQTDAAPTKAARGKLRPGVLLTLAVVAAVAFLLLWRK
jgi:hypothetical protein